MNKSAEWVPTQLHPETGQRVETGILTPDSDTNTLQIGQRVQGPTWLLFLLVPVLLIGVPLSYQAGFVETLGYESKSIKGGGFTSTRSGHSLGLKSMYFRQGQTVFVAYDAKVNAGSLVIRMYNYQTVLDTDATLRHSIESTGAGEVTFEVKESGWHRLEFEGSVLGKSPPGAGYEIDYTLTWGMR